MAAKMLVEEQPGLLRVKFLPRGSPWLWVALVFFVLPWSAMVLVAIASAAINSGAKGESNIFQGVLAFVAFLFALAFVGWFSASFVFDLLGTAEISITATALILTTSMLGLHRRREFLVSEINQLGVEERFRQGKTQGYTTRRVHFICRGKSVRAWTDISLEDSISLSPLLPRYVPSSALKTSS